MAEIVDRGLHAEWKYSRTNSPPGLRLGLILSIHVTLAVA